MKGVLKTICRFCCCISTRILTNDPQFHLIAHRGYTKNFQENTIEAFQDAINNKNIYGVELDVMQTYDKIPKEVLLMDCVNKVSISKPGTI